jgi:hypothetical protein
MWTKFSYRELFICVLPNLVELIMRNLKLALVSIALMMCAQGAKADKRDFSLTNATGYDIQRVFVDGAHSRSWSDDIMGRDIFHDGETIDVTFDGADKGCLWDLKVDWTDGSPSTEWHDFDLCKITSITLKYNRKTDTTTAVTR